MDTPTEISPVHDGSTSRSKKNLTNEQRQEIFRSLLRQSDGGKLKRGLVKNVAALFSVNLETVRRIWRRGKACIATGLPVDVSSRKPGRVGRKRVQFDPNQMMEIPLRRCTNIRSLSKALNIPKSTLHRRIKEGNHPVFKHMFNYVHIDEMNYLQQQA